MYYTGFTGRHALFPRASNDKKGKHKHAQEQKYSLRTSEKNTAYQRKRKLLHHPLPFLAFAWQHFSFSPSREEIKEKFHLLDPLQSCPTLCDPTDGSPPGSAVPGILQARILE